jgi:tRNA nucleotidyltransferase (CCA-adding enzyme)
MSTDARALEPPPAGARLVVDVIQQAGHEAFLVGGCVRDRLLGRAVNDWDVATDAKPEVVMGLFSKTIGTGLQHGTVTVMEGGLPIEVTTYRVEIGYSDGRHPDEVRFTRVLEDDLSRRDFTVNAMAWDPAAGEIRDPFDGQGDLARRCLRAVGTAQERFDEDGLRSMRAVRFATVLDFALDPATEAAIPEAIETFRKVAVERIRAELVKLLRAPRAGWGVAALASTRLLAEFLPEVAQLPAADFAATCAALAASPSDLVVRLAVLLHATADDGGALKRLRFSNQEVREATHLLSLRAVDPAQYLEPPAVRALVARVGASAWPQWLEARRAWATEAPLEALEALAALEQRLAVRSGPLVPTDLALNGREVARALGIKPSRRIGHLLAALLERVWAEPECNTAEGLRALLPEVDAALDAS